MATIKGARRRLAGLIYPGELPARAQRPVAAPTTTAVNVPYRDAMAFFKKRMPTYERLAKVSAAYIDPDGVFLDIGANIGFYTKIVGEAVGFRGTAHLFEPLPHLAVLARETASRLPFSAPVHAHGLGAENGGFDLFVAADGNLGWNTLEAEKATAGMQPVKVRVRRFEPSMIGGAVPSFVKIDVEGFEYQVLEGMLPALEQWEPRPPILCEIGWGAAAHPHWDEEMAVFGKLAGLGYEAVSLDGQPIDLAGLDKTTDVLFLPAR